jgi:hypothetical protein
VNNRKLAGKAVREGIVIKTPQFAKAIARTTRDESRRIRTV